MKRVALAFICLLAAMTVTAQANYREGQVIVKFRSKPNMARGNRGNGVSSGVDAALQLIGGTKAELLMPETGILPAKSKRAGSADTSGTDEGHAGLYVLQFDKSQSVEKTVETLKRLDDVEYAEPNYIRHAFGTAADFTAASLYNEQWYLQAINMPYLWDQPIVNEKRPVIAILDTGISHGHDNLKGQWLKEEGEPEDGEDNDGNGYVDDTYGWDFVSDRTIYVDLLNEHGTHCAGIAAGIPSQSRQGRGIVGANPDARLLDVKVLGDNGQGDDATMIKGINYAVATGADILSMSWGGYEEGEGLREALENASQHCILVSSAGNEGRCVTTGHGSLHGNEDNAPSYPAAYPFVLAVQATNEQGELASFSNYDCDGPYLSTSEEKYNYDLRAPGVNMLSCIPPGYKRLDGTSMACPLVAGAISRLMQCGKVTDFNSLRELLIKTSGATIDMKAAYDATTETMNAETFQCDINGVMMTFHKTSETTAQVGDGTNPAISTIMAGSISVPNDVHGLLVTSVADNAFNGCGQLTEIFLPYYIETVGVQAFVGCSQLSHLLLQSIGVPVCANDAFDASAYTSCNVEVPKGFSENYHEVAPWSNFGSYLTSLEYSYGESISKTIGDYWYAAGVVDARKKQVRINSFMRIEEDGDGIVTVPESIDGYKVIGIRNIFNSLQWLKQVILPDDITEFVGGTFANSQNLETVNFPASLQSIGSFVFRDCISFKNGHVPGHVKTIDGGAFENCGIEDLILEEGVEALGLDAFKHCQQLKSIQMPSTVTTFFSPFDDLPNLETIQVSDGNPSYDSRDNCNAIIRTSDNSLVLGCKNTVIPDEVTEINGFWGTKGLTELHLSKNINMVYSDGTRNLEDLNKVSVDKYNERYSSLPGSNVILEYGGNIVLLCSNSVIPEETEAISTLSTYRNSHITSVTIPAAMNISNLVFAGCPITEVTSLSKKPKAFGYDVFFDRYFSYYATDNRDEDKIYENATLYVPYGTTDVYRNTYGWNYFQNIVELPPVVRGDVNGDGTLTEADYTALVDHLLYRAVEGYHPTAADADEDGRITARDLISLNSLLAGQSSEISDKSYFSLLSPPSRFYPGEMNEANFWLYNYKALLFYLKLPEGMTFADNPISFSEDLGDDYIKDYEIEDNCIRIVLCPALDSEMKCYSGVGFTLRINVASDIAPEGIFTIYNTNVSENDELWDAHNILPYYLKEPPVPQLTFASGQQWQTFYSTEVGCALEEGKGAKAYAVTDIIDQNVIATAIEGGVPERCMVLVGLDEMPTEEVSVGLTAKRVAEPERNYLQGQQIEATGYEPYSTYVLYNNEFVLNSGTSIPGGKGYLSAFQVKNSANARQRLKIVIGDETTSIRKVVETSDKNVEWYDLQGRRLNSQPSASGLYIRNRQKVVIK